ncbi:gephyrin-like molybdotransferase receptor GlpR [Corynebacterium mendelii]|uniref:TIGR04086 family membrane protein n=1 Tax=Corynebacterium mendelii TaxID=2765362 RepID=A0A939IVY3_9CORY|nr:gephyrin-like molybdotransferase receptor GlpR [Corynebacterium mendelii]MBN9644721.1 TIGR04086 family membrane protein [Corynebacterium mendelii]
MTGTGTIVVGLIVVLWLFVLAPLVLRGHKPVSRAGDGLDDTRVVHQGGTALATTRRKPKFSAGDVHVHYDDDPDAEYVDAEPYLAHADSSATATATVTQTGDTATATDTAATGAFAGESSDDTAADTGAAATGGDDTTGSGNSGSGHESAGRKIMGLFTRLSGRDTASGPGSPRDDAADPGASANDSSDADTGSADDDEQEDTTPRFTEADFNEDGTRYRYDESFSSPADLFHPEADYQPADDAVPAAADDAAHDSDDTDSQTGDDDADSPADTAGTVTHLSTEFGFKPTEVVVTDEDREFAARRAGRGGWDPETDKKLQLARYRRRKNVLLVIASLFAGGVISGFMFGGTAWMIPLVTGVLMVIYLLALRRVAREENSRRQRRIRQLRRARLGVKNYSDAELGIPQRLRRPGAIVVEIDDESPDFASLPVGRMPAPTTRHASHAHGSDTDRDRVIDLKNWSRPRRAM